MSNLGEARQKWAEVRKYETLAELRQAARFNGSSSPCIAGHRSLCWKIFLLFESISPEDWTATLASNRHAYGQWTEKYLHFTKHPEELANVAADPLADDPDSPWNTVRQDEVVRAEIAQDVQRLPDEPFYHEPETQTIIIDILFVYCKLHPNGGGYRQGMHELLAPVVFILHQDAVSVEAPSEAEDTVMLDVLNPNFIEHDAFLLFSRIMEAARAFYEVRDSADQGAMAPGPRGAGAASAIVEKSKFIHETCLAKVDPELSNHLKDVEILPQIFLIRWIRLLLGREFPFEQLLVLWDALFAVDPTLDLIDYICVAMLIRIRWSLLEADYSHCLQLLLKYPAPTADHGPFTFVDDAVYLRDHLDASGGASLILKYSGKAPADAPTPQGRSRPETGKGSPTRPRVSRSPLSSPGKFIQQQGGVEAIFQGAARNVLERGEKLGINQAVRDAVGEIKRNVQGFNEARAYSAQSARQALANDSATRAIAALEKRNRLLAGMLDESITNLKSIASLDVGDRVKTLELVEMAAAKMQFVKVHLEDLSISVSGASQTTAAKSDDEKAPGVSGKDSQGNSSSAATDAVAAAEGAPALEVTSEAADTPKDETTAASPLVAGSDAAGVAKDANLSGDQPAQKDGDAQQTDGSADETKAKRPLPIPTRSTLAQSSFSWMLEPDETSPTAKTSPLSPPGSSKSKGPGRVKRNSGNISRERNAFLFGEAVAEAEGSSTQPPADDIFGMEPISRGKERKGLF